LAASACMPGPSTLRLAGGAATVSELVVVIRVILSGPRRTVADPQITPVTQSLGQSQIRSERWSARIFFCSEMPRQLSSDRPSESHTSESQRFRGWSLLRDRHQE
jgi:hypothetical protein